MRFCDNSDQIQLIIELSNKLISYDSPNLVYQSFYFLAGYTQNLAEKEERKKDRLVVTMVKDECPLVSVVMTEEWPIKVCLNTKWFRVI